VLKNQLGRINGAFIAMARMTKAREVRQQVLRYNRCGLHRSMVPYCLNNQHRNMMSYCLNNQVVLNILKRMENIAECFFGALIEKCMKEAVQGLS
jgi:hypothetical protein